MRKLNHGLCFSDLRPDDIPTTNNPLSLFFFFLGLVEWITYAKDVLSTVDALGLKNPLGMGHR